MDRAANIVDRVLEYVLRLYNTIPGEKKAEAFADLFPDDPFVKDWTFDKTDPEALGMLLCHIRAFMTNKSIRQYFSDHKLGEAGTLERIRELMDSPNERIALQARIAALKLQTRLERCDIISCDVFTNPRSTRKKDRYCAKTPEKSPAAERR